ncbi:sodium/glutamate symporter [Entomomonas sp. E2T0]|uniref:sodium/glutamate symporter n=1 Tax=Entomomonas sp. E2T0 TaxID=2930213 RepID=UPI0022285279|nr:sodium/glutamate symporter [Entomomonas sp. E2T0]UYZ84604.1 sodium/glutamate symporter [Entomomonas sp. E2T0]
MLQIDVYNTLVIASLVLLLGQFLVTKVNILNRYTIPGPVAGGLFAAIMLLLAKIIFDWQVTFDMSLRDPLMLMFFASVGLNANIEQLRSGGKMILIFLIGVVGLLFIQNIVGISLATALGMDPLMGLLAGSITLSGGHGTGGAWGDIFVNQYGFAGGIEVAMACATFGLVFGGIIGGPVARYLIKKNKIEEHPEHPETEKDNPIDSTVFEKPQVKRSINSTAMIETIAMLAICLSLGRYLQQLLQGTIFELPTFVCVLFIGVILSNTIPRISNFQIVERSVSILGNVCLSLFLAMALMSLKLWELASLAIPMLIILVIQTIIMALYAVFVTFRLMGKNYDAAVLAAGHCGFGLGATPTAIANMQIVTERFGPSHIAFIVVPMVGAFFIDIVNAIIIKLFLLLPFFTIVTPAV